MKIVHTIADLRRELAFFRDARESIGFVCTMGALHQGHQSLIKTARMNAKRVVASIFVNPLQFSDKKDFEKYTNVLGRDAALLESVGTALLFAPSSVTEMYGDGFQSAVEVGDLSKPFEGVDRPGHFRGVSTVVAMLLNLVQPEFAVFGEKDFQQLRVVEQVVADLKIPVRIMRGPTIREEGGLAMSSRNSRLSAQGLERARAISRGLFIARDAFAGGNREGSFLRSLVIEALRLEPGIEISYVALVDERTLKELDVAAAPCRMLAAATIEGVRLIDNIALI